MALVDIYQGDRLWTCNSVGDERERERKRQSEQEKAVKGQREKLVHTRSDAKSVLVGLRERYRWIERERE